nr:hypothetical protein [Tanacetum cinerariifolium]
MALAVVRNDVPRIKGLFLSSFISKITKSMGFFNVVSSFYVNLVTPLLFSSYERDIIYVLGDGKFSLFPHQYFLKGSTGCKFLEQPEHFSLSIIDLLALLENRILKSLHSFSVCCHAISYSSLESALIVVEGKALNDFPGFVAILIAEFATGGAFNLALKMKRDMIIKNLDLNPTIDAMMRDYLSKATSLKKSLRCWFGSSDQSPWNEHPFCTNRMVSDQRDDSRSSLSQPCPDAIAKSLTPSPDGSRQRHVMLVTPSLRAVSNTSLRIWFRSVISSVSSSNEPKSCVFPSNAIQVLKT